MKTMRSDSGDKPSEAKRANALRRLLLALVGSAAVLALAGLTVVVIVHRAKAAAAFSDRQASPAACTVWDRSAKKALAAMPAGHVQQDARFRLHRAERNCAEGWLRLACADYLMLRAGPPPAGDGKWHRLAVPISCRN